VDFYRAVYPGDTIYTFSGEESCEVKQSEFAGRSVINVRRHVNMNQRGDVVSVYRVLSVLTERRRRPRRASIPRSSRWSGPTRNSR